MTSAFANDLNSTSLSSRPHGGGACTWRWWPDRRGRGVLGSLGAAYLSAAQIEQPPARSASAPTVPTPSTCSRPCRTSPIGATARACWR